MEEAAQISFEELAPLVEEAVALLSSIEIWLAGIAAILLAAVIAYFALRWWISK